MKVLHGKRITFRVKGVRVDRESFRMREGKKNFALASIYRSTSSFLESDSTIAARLGLVSLFSFTLSVTSVSQAKRASLLGNRARKSEASGYVHQICTGVCYARMSSIGGNC